MNNPSRENRLSPRAPMELRIEYRRINSFFSDYTRNISLGGTFIATKTPFPIGTRFKFLLTIPNPETTFELQGEVTWSKSEGDNAGMGICFIWSDEDKKKEFETKVESMMEASLGKELSSRLLKKGK